ncbi:MAG: hypothetical protein WB347_21335 [Terriglobales bacterium]
MPPPRRRFEGTTGPSPEGIDFQQAYPAAELTTAVQAGDVVIVVAQTYNAFTEAADPSPTDSQTGTYTLITDNHEHDEPNDWQECAAWYRVITADDIALTIMPGSWGTDYGVYMLVVRYIDPVNPIAAATAPGTVIVPGTYPSGDPDPVDPVNLIPYTATLDLPLKSFVIALVGDEWTGFHPAAAGTGIMSLKGRFADQCSNLLTGSADPGGVQDVTCNGPNTRSEQLYLVFALKPLG